MNLSGSRTSKFVPLSRKTLPYLLLILLLCLLAYLPVFKLGFTNYDDKRYILENHNLAFGLDNILYFFTHYFDGHYHPLTMLSLMTDHFLFGYDATGYHISNMVLHFLNTWLVFIFIYMLLNDKRIAFATSLLFGITPMGVESVAWLSERKNLLYSFFYLLALICYLRYHGEGKRKFYWLALTAFILSLFSKAQAILFPLILLLIDYYQHGNISSKKGWLEKAPFFLLAVFFGILAQQAQNSFWQESQPDYGFLSRIVFASQAFSMYIFKLIIPVQLSAIYPYPVDAGQALPVYSYLFLAVPLLYFVLILHFIRKKALLLAFSLLFFVVHIVFLLKITGSPYGDYFMADRYTYLACIGIYLLLGSQLVRWNKTGKKSRAVVFILFGIYVLFFMARTHKHSKTWESGISLWGNVLEHFPHYYQALNDFGTASSYAGNMIEAEASFRKAIKRYPDKGPAYNNYGNLKARQGNYEEAILLFNKAIESDPAYAMAYNNRALAFQKTGQYRRAIEDFKTATRLRPALLISWLNMAETYRKSGQYSQALESIETALSIHHESALALEIKSSILIETREYRKALDALDKVQYLGHNNGNILLKNGICHYHLGNFSQALKLLNQSYELGTTDPLLIRFLGFTHVQMGNNREAIGLLNQAISHNRQNPMLFAMRGMAKLRLNNATACDDLQKAYNMGIVELRAMIEENCY